MKLAEQRKKLVKAIEDSMIERNVPISIARVCAGGVLAAASAAGFSIIGTEVTEDMAEKGSVVPLSMRGMKWEGIFKAMLAAGDLARKP